MRRREWIFASIGLAAVVAGIVMTQCQTLAVEKVDDVQLQRARREVKLLDDIYKSAIVLITKHYVDESSDLAAGEAFKVLFESMKEKGWHEVRLLDATGEPINDENSPQDDFERAAVKAMLDGKDYLDEVATHEGSRYLRAATPVPVVMEKCILCHENYRGRKLAGALAYTLPLDTTPGNSKLPGVKKAE
jgi:hypothetical protein